MENPIITNYVVAFLFNGTMDKVWLIEKQKPEWQKGRLNGLGGKIEENESPMTAIIRELKEESGVELTPEELIEYGVMSGINNDNTGFRVHIFTGITNQQLVTKETEVVKQISLDILKEFKTIGNVPMLIQAAYYKLSESSNFNYLILNY